VQRTVDEAQVGACARLDATDGATRSVGWREIEVECLAGRDPLVGPDRRA
jgi:hypothetical protein